MTETTSQMEPKMSKYDHEHTIGEFEWEGKTYEIDWPFSIEDETKRDDYGVIYLDGVMVGEVCPPLGQTYTEESQVVEDAIEAIMSGDTNDQG